MSSAPSGGRATEGSATEHYPVTRQRVDAHNEARTNWQADEDDLVGAILKRAEDRAWKPAQQGGRLARHFVDEAVEARFASHQFRQSMVFHVAQGAAVQLGPLLAFLARYMLVTADMAPSQPRAVLCDHGGLIGLSLNVSLLSARIALHKMPDQNHAQRLASLVWTTLLPLLRILVFSAEDLMVAPFGVGGARLMASAFGGRSYALVWLSEAIQVFCLGLVHGSLGIASQLRWPLAALLAYMIWHDAVITANELGAELRAALAIALSAACALAQFIELSQREAFATRIESEALRGELRRIQLRRELALNRRIEQARRDKERLAWEREIDEKVNSMLRNRVPSTRSSVGVSARPSHAANIAQPSRGRI